MLPTSKWQQILGELGSFNGHPPLGVNATCRVRDARDGTGRFQWAPTLGGECYDSVYGKRNRVANPFQWAPTLGGECYGRCFGSARQRRAIVSMGTHPWG